MTKSVGLSKGESGWGLVLAVLFLGFCAYSLLVAPSERNMGEIYRIIYVHVPSAFASFAAALILCVYSVLSLRKGSAKTARMGKAWAEVGLVFSILTLATGSIWGKPTWGTWWTWDARLTTTFLLALLYAGYLLLHASLPEGPQRTKGCAILGILILVDVPIIYKSVSWWRTLHQPPSIMRRGGSTMSNEILIPLLVGAALMIVIAWYLTHVREKNLEREQELEKLSFEKMQ